VIERSSRFILVCDRWVGEPANAGHQRRARTAASDKPCIRDMLIARPLHAFVRMPAGM
jgi:hypothetical protein